MYSYGCVVFDLDGVITKTALVHAAAWKAMFDEFLKIQNSENFREFTHENDYLPFVDGKPRYKGVQSFLESRNIVIPFGSPEDSSEKETICGLGNRKNVKFLEILENDGIEVYVPVVALLKELQGSGVRLAIASSSKNCQHVLQVTGLEGFFETRVDGVVSAELGLKGKPEGDIFVRAAGNVNCLPEQSVVIEDAVSGVQAGVNGKFGLVIGVARESNEEELKKSGADVVVTSFEGVTGKDINEWFKQKNK